MRIEQSPEKRIEQHASWIAINPVIGCPSGCEYCFLGPDNLRPKRPEELRSPDQTMQDLLDSKYYAPTIPVAIGTYTDMFATPKNQEYARRWLDTWEDAALGNPLVFITKGEIPDDIAATMGRLNANRLPVVAFLSISGLGREIEKGVNHKKLIGNIGRLAQYDVPVVHYWRPLMPQNSTQEVMEHVHSLVAGRTTSSFVGGLRLTEAMKKQIMNWSDILEIYTEGLDSAWDEGGYNHVSVLRADKPDHPIYEAVSCTMANATRTPEYNGIYGTDICARSNCPAEQRAICGTHTPIPWDKVSEVAHRLDFASEFEVDTENRVIKLQKPLDVDELTNTIHSTRMRVEVPYVAEGHYPWGTHHTRESVFISSEIPRAKRPKQLLGSSVERLQKLQEEYKEMSGTTAEDATHFLQVATRLAGDCTGLCATTDQEIIDLEPAEHNVPRWRSIYASNIIFNIFNMLSCLDKKVDQEFVDRAVAYTPRSENWRFDLANLTTSLYDAMDYASNPNGSTYEGVRLSTLLPDLVGCVLYGHKESGLGNISLTMGQLATRLQEIIDHSER